MEMSRTDLQIYITHARCHTTMYNTCVVLLVDHMLYTDFTHVIQVYLLLHVCVHMSKVHSIWHCCGVVDF